MARAAALLAALLAIAGCGGGGSKTTSTTPARVDLGPSFDDIATLPGAQNRPPPFTSGAKQLQLRLRKIGLPALQAEGQVLHIHEHVDLYVGGRKVTVPANVGIDPTGAFISPLHTHDTTGIIHVESPTASSFSLGQVFGVWGVPLSGNGIGSLKAAGGKLIKTWVNGKPVAADPTRIVLAPHQEIVIAYGTAAQMPDPVPSSYDFPAGL